MWHCGASMACNPGYHSLQTKPLERHATVVHETSYIRVAVAPSRLSDVKSFVLAADANQKSCLLITVVLRGLARKTWIGKYPRAVGVDACMCHACVLYL